MQPSLHHQFLSPLGIPWPRSFAHKTQHKVPTWNKTSKSSTCLNKSNKQSFNNKTCVLDQSTSNTTSWVNCINSPKPPSQQSTWKINYFIQQNNTTTYVNNRWCARTSLWNGVYKLYRGHKDMKFADPMNKATTI